MKIGSKISFLRRMAMPQEELEAYYREQRAVRFQNDEQLHGIIWRKHIHGLIHILLAANRVLAGQKLTIIGDKRKHTNKPIIYACTHVGRYDIEMAIQIIRASVYLLMGDPGPVYKNLDGLVLWLNGTIFVDTDYKQDRYIGKETCVKLLKQGGNLLIFPEGAWNITENQIVMPLFPGTAEMAIRTGTEIVPIAIEQYGKHYYANIGESISPEGCTLAQKQELTDLLRDALCTLKWNIWTLFPSVNRSSLPPDAAKQFLDGIMRESENGYIVEEIIRTRYHPSVVAPEKAFAHLDNLIPCRKNAFLWDKRSYN